MGGVYENKKERSVFFVVDESLCEDALFPNADTIRLLPSNYYQLSDPEKIVIPVGDDKAGVEVQLTEAFFNDPWSIKNTYVLPLRLTGVIDLDSLLQGKSTTNQADRRIAGHWTAAPKDFTMFAVKFINPYDGTYLHYGTCEVFDPSGKYMESRTYSAKYVEQNELWRLMTQSRSEVAVSGNFKSDIIPKLQDPSLPPLPPLQLRLKFTSDDYLAPKGVDCTIEAMEGSPYTITGNGKYTTDTEEYGGKKRDAISLKYTIKYMGYSYTATDVLVYRNRNVNLETYTPTILTW
jgi:hypothetical protein